jgi:GxxExxY protein
MLVADTVIVDVKAVPQLIPAHDAQILACMRMSGLPMGLLLAVHASWLKDGPRRFVG